MEHIEKITSEIDSRIKNIKIYHPFYSIYAEGYKDSNFDMPSLILAVLSYLVYEGKLNAKGISFNEIKEFIRLFLMKGYAYDIDDKQSIDLTREVINKLDANYSYKYQSCNTKREETLNVSLIKEDIKTLEFFITTDGLDFFLKTKEYSEEAQITISLLLFKKQLEAGSFGYALDLVRRLNIEVQKRIEEKSTILNIVVNGGSNGIDEYKKYFDRIAGQFSQEETVFKDTLKFLDDFYKNEIEQNKMGKKDKEGLKILSNIEEELLKAQSLHTRLIDEVLDMSNDYDRILDIKMKSAFSEKFNFERVFEQGCVEYNDIRVLGLILQPFLNRNIKKRFSIQKIFQPQKVKKAEERKTEKYESPEVSSIETIDMLTQKRVENNYFAYTAMLLNLLSSKPCVYLEDFVSYIKETYSDDVVFNVDFVPFLARINHTSRDKYNPYKKVIDIKELFMKDINLMNDIEVCLRKVMGQNKKYSSWDSIIIESLPDSDVVFDDIIKVTNMKFVLV